MIKSYRNNCWIHFDQLEDNVKARKINGKIQNEFKKSSGKPYRSQWEIHEYFKALLEE